MNTARKVFAGIFVVCVLLIAGIFIYITLNGKGLIEEALRTAFNDKVDIGSIRYQFPLGMSVEDVRVGRIGGVKKMDAQLQIGSLLARKLNFSSIVFVEPSIRIHRKKTLSKEATEAVGAGPAPEGLRPYQEGGPQVPAPTGEPKAKGGGLKKVGVYVEKLAVQNGKVSYLEESPDKEFSFGIEEVELEAGGVGFPFDPVKTDFQLSGRLVKKESPLSGSRLKASGWVNIAARDIRADLELTEEDGAAGLTAEVVGKDNNVKVDGILKVRNLMVGSKKQEPEGSSTMDDLILGALSSMGVEIGARFSFETKMDDFRMNNISFSGSVTANHFEGILSGPSP